MSNQSIESLTWRKSFPDGSEVVVTPCYDEDGIPHKYEGDCSIGNGVCTFTVAPFKSADGQPECMINVSYPVQMWTEIKDIDPQYLDTYLATKQSRSLSPEEIETKKTELRSNIAQYLSKPTVSRIFSTEKERRKVLGMFIHSRKGE